MEAKKIPLKTYRNIMNSLGGGTVPKEGLGYIAVGREKELDSLLRDTNIVSDGGATFRLVVGDYGSGKTFLLQTIKEYAVKRDFIVAEADLSPDRSLIGTSSKEKGLATYRELMANVSNKTNQSGKALRKVLDNWVGNLFARAAMKMGQGGANMELLAENELNEDLSKIQDMAYGFEFSQALRYYWKANRTADLEEKFNQQEAALKWFRASYMTKQECKSTLGINSIITDENWFDIILIWSQFFVMAGYKGFFVLIDELKNLADDTRAATRQRNYEKMLTIYNATLQGKAEYLGIIMGGIPSSIYDKNKGVFSYEAMRSRLSTGTYKEANMTNMMTPIIKVLPLTKEEMYILLEKLAEIHADLNGYARLITDDELLDFIKIAYMKRENTNFITPRTMIRDFIQVLDMKEQNPERTIAEILSAYRFTIDEEQAYEDY